MESEKKITNPEIKTTVESDKKKELTKSELEEQNAALLAKLAKLEAVQQPEVSDADDPKRPVTIELPYDGDKYKDDLYVSINNKNWQIQRGKKVVVPFYVAQAVKESAEQDQATARLIAIHEMAYQKLADGGKL